METSETRIIREISRKSGNQDEDLKRDLEENDEAGDPEAGEEGVVDDVEHGDLEPGERSSAINL